MIRSSLMAICLVTKEGTVFTLMTNSRVLVYGRSIVVLNVIKSFPQHIKTLFDCWNIGHALVILYCRKKSLGIIQLTGQIIVFILLRQ